MINQQAINILNDLEQCLDDYCELNDEGKAAFRMAVTALELFGNSEQLPSAQPEPPEECERCMMEHTDEMEKLEVKLAMAQPKRGRWISADAIFGGVPFYCSECGENTRDTVMGKPRWNFCPMCGSYNGGEQDG